MRSANFIDITGKKFGRLLAVKYLGQIKGGSVWECICDCGTVCQKRASHLKSGASFSCGCYNKELVSVKFKTHGLSYHPLFRVHRAMLNRCFNPKNKRYKNYGGRGISVCDRWKNFELFYSDVISDYEIGLTLERKDVNGNYCPENVIWATTKEQARNKTDTVLIEHGGKKMILSDWAEQIGVKAATLSARINSGWTVQKALTTPTLKTWNRRVK